jgi:hypothetical protein
MRFACALPANAATATTVATNIKRFANNMLHQLCECKGSCGVLFDLPKTGALFYNTRRGFVRGKFPGTLTLPGTLRIVPLFQDEISQHTDC